MAVDIILLKSCFGCSKVLTCNLAVTTANNIHVKHPTLVMPSYFFYKHVKFLSSWCNHYQALNKKIISLSFKQTKFYAGDKILFDFSKETAIENTVTKSCQASITTTANLNNNLNNLIILRKQYLHSGVRPMAMLNNTNTSTGSTISSTGSDGSGDQTDYDSTKTERLRAQWKLDQRGIRRQSIITCGPLYSKWQQTKSKLYKYAPKNGIHFDVEYYDTKYLTSDKTNKDSDSDPDQKTIVLLHGAPGSYKDFSSQITYFAQRGYRVIAPNFPDYSAGLRGFRHSTKERFYYIEDFFRAINLTKIDILAAHSVSVYILFELLEVSQYLNIKSIGLFNNPGYTLPDQLAVTNFRMFFLQLFDYGFLRPTLNYASSFFIRSQGIVNQPDKLDNLLLSASCVGYSEHTNLERQYKLIRNKKIPTFIVISDRDKLIPSEYFDMVLEDLEATTNHICYYDSDGNLVKPRSNEDDYVKVVNFQTGGHYSFQNYANAVNVEMEQFIRNIL